MKLSNLVSQNLVLFVTVGFVTFVGGLLLTPRTDTLARTLPSLEISELTTDQSDAFQCEYQEVPASDPEIYFAGCGGFL